MVHPVAPPHPNGITQALFSRKGEGVKAGPHIPTEFPYFRKWKRREVSNFQGRPQFFGQSF